MADLLKVVLVTQVMVQKDVKVNRYFSLDDHSKELTNIDIRRVKPCIIVI